MQASNYRKSFFIIHYACLCFIIIAGCKNEKISAHQAPVGKGTASSPAANDATATGTGSATPLPSPGTDATSTAAGSTPPASTQSNAPVVVSTTCSPPPAPVAANLNTDLDVLYSTNGGIALKLDVVYPKIAGLHPLVVLVHGGGFTSGDKADQRQALNLLASQGFVAASVNYRLSVDDKSRFPAPLQDVRCAVRWLRANAAKYSIDPSRVAAEGDSAGGTLVALLATTVDIKEFDSPDCSVGAAAQVATVKGVIDNAGRGDLHVDAANNPAVAVASIVSLLGVDPNKTPGTATENLIKLASPLTHIDKNSAPFLLIHGDKDPRVLASQNVRMESTLKAAGVFDFRVDDPAWGHAPPILSLDPTYQRGLCASLSFLRKYLAP